MKASAEEQVFFQEKDLAILLAFYLSLIHSWQLDTSGAISYKNFSATLIQLAFQFRTNLVIFTCDRLKIAGDSDATHAWFYIKWKSFKAFFD